MSSLAWGPSPLFSHQARTGAPWLGVPPVDWSGTHRGTWLGSYSAVQWVRHLMGQPLYCSALMLALGREAMVRSPPPMRDSAASPCFHGCLAFLHRHFPLRSPPLHPLNPSLRSQQQLSPWDCSTIPKLPLPAAVPSRGPAFLSRVCMAAARTVYSHSI